MLFTMGPKSSSMIWLSVSAGAEEKLSASPFRVLMKSLVADSISNALASYATWSFEVASDDADDDAALEEAEADEADCDAALDAALEALEAALEALDALDALEAALDDDDPPQPASPIASANAQHMIAIARVFFLMVSRLSRYCKTLG